MNRRGFIRLAGVAVAGLAAAPVMTAELSAELAVRSDLAGLVAGMQPSAPICLSIGDTLSICFKGLMPDFGHGAGSFVVARVNGELVQLFAGDYHVAVFAPTAAAATIEVFPNIWREGDA